MTALFFCHKNTVKPSVVYGTTIGGGDMLVDLNYERAVFVCSGCSHDIYEGEYVWHILGEQFCNKCIRAAREAAIFDEPE